MKCAGFRLVLACASVACASASAESIQRPPSAPSIRMVRIAPGVTLEVLDWGGQGPTLVFLAGLGNTAHVFDDFAPQFTDRFHVIGITRRGFGASSDSPPPRELDTLVADITAVLDTLHLQRVTLIGHSIAGEELTRFAALHPARCGDLIYLDAAYELLLRFVQRVVAQSRARVARLPQYTVVDVHGGSHYIFLQRPREVAGIMRAFLGG